MECPCSVDASKHPLTRRSLAGRKHAHFIIAGLSVVTFAKRWIDPGAVKSATVAHLQCCHSESVTQNLCWHGLRRGYHRIRRQQTMSRLCAVMPMVTSRRLAFFKRAKEHGFGSLNVDRNSCLSPLRRGCSYAEVTNRSSKGLLTSSRQLEP
jgi:hypothetical protein